MTEPPEGGGIASDNPWSSLQVPSEGSAEEAGGPASMETQEAPEGGQPTADSETQTAGEKADEPMPGTAEDRAADERGEESERTELDAHSHVAPSSPGVVSVDVEPEEDMVGEAYEALGRAEEPAAAIVPDEPEPGTNRWAVSYTHLTLPTKRIV